MRHKIKRDSWYGFDDKKVAELLEGGLTFCAEFCVQGEYEPVAVYRAKTPNRAKGHKKYVLLQKTGKGGLVRGMTPYQMKKERYQSAVLCEACNTIVYSIMRHHMNCCGCPNDAFADGGKDYLRAGAKNLDKIKYVKLDLITGKIVK